jgi:hypothetical protein
LRVRGGGEPPDHRQLRRRRARTHRLRRRQHPTRFAADRSVAATRAAFLLGQCFGAAVHCQLRRRIAGTRPVASERMGPLSVDDWACRCPAPLMVSMAGLAGTRDLRLPSAMSWPTVGYPIGSAPAVTPGPSRGRSSFRVGGSRPSHPPVNAGYAGRQIRASADGQILISVAWSCQHFTWAGSHILISPFSAPSTTASYQRHTTASAPVVVVTTTTRCPGHTRPSARDRLVPDGRRSKGRCRTGRCHHRQAVLESDSGLAATGGRPCQRSPAASTASTQAVRRELRAVMRVLLRRYGPPDSVYVQYADPCLV